MSSEARIIQGPAGNLDARMAGPTDGQPVVLLHPHPLFGGTMGSRLVYDVSKALSDAGFRTLRFDFRGVGRSEGRYGNGLGEADDAAAAFDLLHKETGRLPAVVGYSFGAAVGVNLATFRPVMRLLLVACPADVRDSALDPIDDARLVKCPVSFLGGDADELVPFADMQCLASSFKPAAHFTRLPGAHHFLSPEHNGRVTQWAVERLKQA